MKLNGATIPDEIVARIARGGGREHCYADLVPSRPRSSSSICSTPL